MACRIFIWGGGGASFERTTVEANSKGSGLLRRRYVGRLSTMHLDQTICFGGCDDALDRMPLGLVVTIRFCIGPS